MNFVAGLYPLYTGSIYVLWINIMNGSLKKTGSILHVYTVVNKYMNHLFFMNIIYYNILFIICNM